MARDLKSIIRSVAAIALIVAIFFFLGRRLYRDAAELNIQEWSVDPLRLTLSLILLISSLALSANVWRTTLRLFDVQLGFPECFKITFVSSVGKYLPGKIWAYVGQVYLGHRAGVSKSVCAISAAVVFVAYNLSGLLLFSASLSVWKGFPAYMAIVLVLFFASLLISLFSRRTISLIVKIGSRISGRFQSEAGLEKVTIRAGVSDVSQVFLVLAADWTLFCGGIYFLINSFYKATVSEALVVCGSLVVSVIAGVLSIFVPAGLGVREGVQSYLLSQVMPASIAIVIALVLRLWMTVGEVLCFLAALRVKNPRLI